MTLRGNVIQGVLGFLGPAVIVLASYPALLRHLGAAAFGIYLLAISMSGSVVFLDLGLAAATVKFVAEDLASGRTKAAADVIVTSLVVFGATGLIAGGAIAAAAPFLAVLFKVESQLAGAAILAFRLAGLHFLILLPSLIFVSVAKAVEQFDRAAIFMCLLSLATYGAGAVAVLAGAGLTGAMAATVAANLIAVALVSLEGVRLCHARGIELREGRAVAYRRLLRFGWSLTVNSMAGFLMVQLQRYVVAAAMGPAAVSVYQAAAAVPARIHLAVNAATEVMFPFSSVSRDRAFLRRIYLRMLGGSAVVGVGGSVALILLARPLLTLWLGAPFAASVLPLVPVFALAYLFLTLSPAPFHLVNGIGRPGLNTVFCLINAMINILLIAVFAWNGLTLMKMAWAFAAANIVTNVGYQITVETLIWRRAPRALEVPA